MDAHTRRCAVGFDASISGDSGSHVLACKWRGRRGGFVNERVHVIARRFCQSTPKQSKTFWHVPRPQRVGSCAHPLARFPVCARAPHNRDCTAKPGAPLLLMPDARAAIRSTTLTTARNNSNFVPRLSPCVFSVLSVLCSMAKFQLRESIVAIELGRQSQTKKMWESLELNVY